MDSVDPARRNQRDFLAKGVRCPTIHHARTYACVRVLNVAHHINPGAGLFSRRSCRRRAVSFRLPQFLAPLSAPFQWFTVCFMLYVLELCASTTAAVRIYHLVV